MTAEIPGALALDDAPLFEPEILIGELEKHGVEYLIIGGIATVLHGAVLGTTDVDVLCADSDDNRARLAEALTALSARVRGSRSRPAAPIPKTLLEGVSLMTFETRFGDLDVIFEAAGGFTHAAMVANALTMESEGVRMHVVCIDDLIALKRAAGRPTDLRAAEMLEALREMDPATFGPADQ